MKLNTDTVYEVTSKALELIVLGVKEAILEMGGLIRIISQDSLGGASFYVAVVVHDPNQAFNNVSCSIRATNVNGLIPVEV